MSLGDVWLGYNAGSLVLLSAMGRELTIENRLLMKEEETRSGRRVRDLIATKKTFKLKYSLIDNVNLEIYINYYESHQQLYLRWQKKTSTQENYNVWMNSIDRKRKLMFDGGLWGNVIIELIEV